MSQWCHCCHFLSVFNTKLQPLSLKISRKLCASYLLLIHVHLLKLLILIVSYRSQQYMSYISQGSVETLLRCSGKYLYCFVGDLSRITGAKFYKNCSTFVEDITKMILLYFLTHSVYVHFCNIRASMQKCTASKWPINSVSSVNG